MNGIMRLDSAGHGCHLDVVMTHISWRTREHLENSDLDSDGDSESEMDCGSEPHSP